MILPVLAGLSILGILAFVLAPLFRTRQSPAVAAGAMPEYESLLESRERAYDALRELESDRELGKVSEADYERLHARYTRQAVAALKAADEHRAALDARIEQQVRQARAAGAVATVPVTAPRPAPTARAPRSLARRPLPLFGSLAALFLLFAAGVMAVYVQGSRAAGRATPIATLQGEPPAALWIDPGDAQQVLVGGGSGLAASGDGGRSWQPVQTLGGRIGAIARDADDKTLYALADGVLQSSTDLAKTWKATGDTENPLTALAADPEEPGKLYAFDTKGAFLTSTDRGATWEATPEREGRAVSSLAVASPDPLTLFGGAQGTGVVFGAGDSWGPANGQLGGALPTEAVHQVVFDRSTGESAVLPSGQRVEGTLYAATDIGIFRSTDYGTSWFRLPLNADVRALAVGPPGSNVMLAVADTGEIYRSSDRGVRWDG